ncbi:hypothetical protein [Acidovorax temperans]
MALTKTRTRTQTTLTKLARLIANVHGELALVEKLLGSPDELPDAQLRGLAAKRAELRELRTALYASLHQFDPRLDPTDIGADDGWLKKFGRGGGKTAEGRYLKALELTL